MQDIAEEVAEVVRSGVQLAIVVSDTHRHTHTHI